MHHIDDDWVRALDAKLAAGTGSTRDPLVIEYVVADDAATYTYHLVLGPDGDRAHPGPADAPDVSFRLDPATAERIRSGEISAEAAFLAGDLDLDGDATALIEAHRTRPAD